MERSATKANGATVRGEIGRETFDAVKALIVGGKKSDRRDGRWSAQRPDVHRWARYAGWAVRRIAVLRPAAGLDGTRTSRFRTRAGA